MQSYTGFGCPLCTRVQTDLARMRKLVPSFRSLNALSFGKRRPGLGVRQLVYTSAAKSTGPPAPLHIDNTVVQLSPSGKRWENIDRWVMFSDLHVSVKTLATCIAVLQKVKQEATKREAGILFLGDFWHARGALPVEPLNAILHELQTWRQPTLMLVGNHDQISVGGLAHALKPLAAACSAIQVLEVPTLYNGSLWLPYRKDHTEIKEALEAAGVLKAVFAHADVRGAMMNEAFQAKAGLESDLFPDTIPTYTGHYHKPHTVADTNITYIGSPYQVSRSEAGQSKALVVLDREWQELERIPLDLGPRHFNLTDAQPVLPPDLRPGDKIKWTLPDRDAADDAQQLTQELLDKGIEVEVVIPPAQSAPRISTSEDMGALALFHNYAYTVGMSQPAIDAALDLLGDFEGTGVQLKHEAAVIQFEELELEGYGPFREPCVYSLAQRGFCVVTGRNEDDLGSESNGAGKSALVMAPLWALTGKSDARSEGGQGGGLTSSEVLNDEASLARVCLRGQVNGAPFAIERSVKSGKRKRGAVKTALKFEHDGEDLTCLEQRLTQAAIDRVLGTDLLVRAAFHGQSDVTALLEAGDDRFKAELGWVVNLDMWDQAKQLASQRLKALNTTLASVVGQQQLRQAELLRLEQQVEEAQQSFKEWTTRSLQQQDLLQTELSEVETKLQASLLQCRSALDQLQHWQQHAEAAGQQQALSRRLQEAEQQLTDLQQAAREATEELNTISQQQDEQFEMQSHAAAHIPGSAGIASEHFSTPGSEPLSDSDVEKMLPAGVHAEESSSDTSTDEDSSEVDQQVGGWPNGGYGAWGQPKQWGSHARNSQDLGMRQGQLWKPEGGASTTVATMSPWSRSVSSTPNAVPTTPPITPPSGAQSPEIQAQAAMLQELQKQAMQQQAELGACQASAQAATTSYKRYISMAETDSSHAEQLCDRCLQPIDDATFQATRQRLQVDMQQALALQAEAAQTTHKITTAVAEAEQALQQLQQKAAEAAAAAWALQMAEQEAALQLERDKNLAEQAAQDAKQRQQAEAQAAAREAAEHAQHERWLTQQAAKQEAEALKAAARARERDALAAVSVAEATCNTFRMEYARFQQARAYLQQTVAATVQQAQLVLDRLSPNMHPPANGTSPLTDEDVLQASQQCSRFLRAAESASHDRVLSQQQLDGLRQTVNPYSAEHTRLTQLYADGLTASQALQVQKRSLQSEVGVWGEVERGFGRTGVQSFAIEGVLGELQELTARYLEQLSSGVSLSLAAFRPSTKMGAAEIERITKTVHINSETGMRERSIRQLSGGERRRIALALALGFADLTAGRGQLRCNLIVLDEVLQQLDEEGKGRVGRVLRNLPQSSVLVVAQADSYLTRIVDDVDVVVKRNGCALLESGMIVGQ